MLVTLFDQQLAPKQAMLNENRIIHSRFINFRNQRQHIGFSLKYVIHGEERYVVNGQARRVRSGQYLLVNHGSEIETTISGYQVVEGVCLYLKPELMAEVNESLTQSISQVLDHPFEYHSQTPQYHEHVYCFNSSRLGHNLHVMTQQIQSRSLKSEDLSPSFYYGLGESLAMNQADVKLALSRLACVKPSTRVEIFRRLSLARDFIHDNLGSEIDLDLVSREACLSKYHFLRLFRQAFGLTPHQYLISLRLERARYLLLNTPKALYEICQDVGLKDLSSFGRRFKKVYGRSPAAYRRDHAA